MRIVPIVIVLVAAMSVQPVRASDPPAWAPGMSGQLAPLELLTAIVGTADPTRHELAVEFNVPVVIDSDALVDEEALDGLPLEKNRRQLKAHGFKDAELDESHSYGEMTIPFQLSDAARDGPDGFLDYLQQSAAQIDRLRAPSTVSGGSENLCSGLLPGSEWTARTSSADSDAPRKVVYRCTLTEVDGDSRGTWLRVVEGS